MNRKHLLSAAVAATFAVLSTASIAQDHPGDHYGYNITQQKFVSTKTRAQVQQELLQARAAGELRTDADGYGYLPQQAVPSSRTRAQVQAETLQAMKDGSLSRGQQALYSRG